MLDEMNYKEILIEELKNLKMETTIIVEKHSHRH